MDGWMVSWREERSVGGEGWRLEQKTRADSGFAGFAPKMRERERRGGGRAQAIHRFDRFAHYGGGAFHPARPEVIISSAVSTDGGGGPSAQSVRGGSGGVGGEVIEGRRAGSAWAASVRRART